MNTLEFGKYYHIYNRGNNSEDLFRTNENHYSFLQLYEKYICPVADTFAWVLMKNHFHFLVRIKEEWEMEYLPPHDTSRSGDPGRSISFLDSSIPRLGTGRSTPDQTFHGPKDMEGSGLHQDKTFHGPKDMEGSLSQSRKKPVPSHQFAHLFNAYTKYYNRLFHRTGSLFEKNFKRIEITSERQFRQVVIYINTNPVHHKIRDDYTDYPWSGYQSIISSQPSLIKREQVMEWFGDRENMIEMHNQKLEIEMMDDLWLE